MKAWWLIIRRPWHDSAFRVLALALFVASLALTTVVLLRAELDARFHDRGAEMLGGDLLLSGSRAPDPEQRAILNRYPHSDIVQFQSVVIHDGQILLVSAKAVDENWPLLGEVELTDARFSDQHRSLRQGPPAGEVWVADQLLDRLNLKVGEQLQLGQASLTISAMIRREPDQGAAFYGLSPRVLLNIADLDATGVVGPGSRIDYAVALLSDQPEQIKQALEDTLRADQSSKDVQYQLERSMGPLQQLTLWISLGVMLVTLLCGAAIYLTTGLRVAKRATLAALLRTFGASRATILRRLLGHELAATLPLILAGTALGTALTLITRQLLGWHGPLAASPLEWLMVVLAPLALLAAFALPRLSALVQVPAVQVLSAQGQQSLRRSGLELSAALLGPMAIAAMLTGSLKDLGWMLLLLAGFGVLLPALLWPLLVLLDRRSRNWSVTTRLAVRRLSRRRTTTLPLMAALTLAMAILTLAGQSGSGLLQEWQRKLPADAPNHFVFNLFADDQPVLQDWLQRHQARSEPLYPIVRGRLTLINGVPVREAVSKENDRAERALNRDLALTEEQQLPSSNAIRDGVWHEQRKGEVSVEADLADAMGLQLGDELTFVGSRSELVATVSSIRTVDWDSFAPNFYFMFSVGAFAAQDTTWLTSFWLPEGDGRRVAELMSALPHITLLDVNALLERAQAIVTQASQATALLAGLLVAAALLVLMAALLAGADQRQRDQQLLRALGARQSLLRKVNWLEFFALGFSAALGATLTVFAALIPLGNALFAGQLPWSWWLFLPLIMGVGIALLGGLVGRQVAASGLNSGG